MTNPFEDESQPYFALQNEEGQYSLWPTSIQVPKGWNVAFGPEARQACLKHIEENWTDMRPKSLVNAMSAMEGERTDRDRLQ